MWVNVLRDLCACVRHAEWTNTYLSDSDAGQSTILGPGEPVKLRYAVFKIAHCIICVVICGKVGLGIISYICIMHHEKVTFGAGFPCKVASESCS